MRRYSLTVLSLAVVVAAWMATDAGCSPTAPSAAPAGSTSSASTEKAAPVAVAAATDATPAKAAAAPVAPTASAAPTSTGPGRPPVSDAMRAVILFNNMSDPEIRAQIGLTLDQEDKIKAAQEKVNNIHAKAESDVMKKMVPDATAKVTPEREAEVQKAIAEAWTAAQPQVMPVMEDAVKSLTPAQVEKLRVVFDKRVRLMQGNGPLYILGTEKGKALLLLTDDVSAKIRKMLDDNADKADALRKGVAKAVENVPIEMRFAAQQARMREVAETIEANAVKAKVDIYMLLSSTQKARADRMLVAVLPDLMPGFPKAGVTPAGATPKATTTVPVAPRPAAPKAAAPGA